MKIKAIAEACMWLPGFAPEEDPLVVLGPVGSARCAATDDAPASVSAVGGSTIEKRATWPALRASDLADLSGPVGKFEANVKAITLLRELEHEGREPSPEERTTLNRFTGWGGLPQAFNPSQSDTAWAARSVQLAQLLTPEEYKSAHDSTPNSHYTPVEVVSAMWSAVKALGFQGGRIVEPSCGNGYFLGAMPEDVASMSTVTQCATSLVQVSQPRSGLEAEPPDLGGEG